MDKVIQLHYDFYNSINRNLEIRKTLEQENITILDGFNKNIELVNRYYQTYYNNHRNRIVLCGINPGKNGAGKTGIPFIDYKGASYLLSDVHQDEKEQSAQFILSIINEIGSETFFNNVYMTNISWFGFIKGGNNFNYYELPSPLQTTFTKSFLAEMSFVQPKVIIPLSKEVELTLKEMMKEGKLNYPVVPRLPHPYYCSIGKRPIKYKDVYIKKITSLIDGNPVYLN